MRFIFKALIVVVIILAFPLSMVLVFKNWSTAIGTSTPMSLKLGWLEQYEPIYLFWSGVILAVLLIIFLLITLFWPRSQSLYLHQKSDGQVTVSKKAIEHFVDVYKRQPLNLAPVFVVGNLHHEHIEQS